MGERANLETKWVGAKQMLSCCSELEIKYHSKI
jgi:hypothetical protein